MKKLLAVADICERYGCSEKTARRYMRQMEHMERPLRVTETALESWEINRTYNPVQVVPEIRPKAKAKVAGKFIIPRKRPSAGVAR